MSGAEARAWWADVEHLREGIERRRERERERERERVDGRDTEPGTDERRSSPRVVPVRGQARFGDRGAEAHPEPRPRRGSDRAGGAGDASGFAPRRTVRIRGQAIPTLAAPHLRPVEDPPADTRRRPEPVAEPPSARPPRSRRPKPRPAERVGANPDRIALWAVALGLLLILVAVTSAHGATPRREGSVAFHAGVARAGGYLRLQFGARTLARGMSGRDVRTLQHLLGALPTGLFGPQTNAAVRSFQRSAGLAVDGVVGPATRGAVLQKRMRARMATLYGPGLFGNRTACGEMLTRGRFGVADRTLACGTAVTLYHSGLFVTVPVIDRGPFTAGVSLDLTSATAAALGVDTTGPVLADR
jgi:rare lipoprotein A